MGVGTSFGQHPCAVDDCHIQVSGSKLMCTYHWSKVPEPLRYELGQAWQSWRLNRTPRGHREYVEMRDEAILGVEALLAEQRKQP